MTRHRTPRARRTLQTGQTVWYRDQPVTITSLGDTTSILVRDAATRATHAVAVAELSSTPPDPPDVLPVTPIPSPSGHALEVARHRLECIEPLLHAKHPNVPAQVKARAAVLNLHFTTLYRWKRAYEEDGDLNALAPRARTGGTTRPRLTPAVEAIIARTIETEYLERGKSARRVQFVVRQQCELHDLPVPYRSTVRARIDALDPVRVATAREGYSAALALQPVRGQDPRGTHPLALVQIDHTLLPVFVQRDGMPPSRPWLTLVLDVYSRMVLGFHLSCHAPNATAVGQALQHAFLPKEAFLSTHGVSGAWPCWGLPEILACDNAREFRGRLLRSVCTHPRYAINLDFRPVARPNYGAHVERLAGTLKGWMRDLTGAMPTSRRARPKRHRDHALFTTPELEGWLTELIVEVYHNATHSQLQQTPLVRYLEGLAGRAGQPGCGVPERLSEDASRRLRLDFMPFAERTVQREGIHLRGNVYHHPALDRFALASSAASARQKTRYVVRYDPNDLREVHVLDPTVDEYIPAPSVRPMPKTGVLSQRQQRREIAAQSEHSVYEGQKKLEAREKGVSERARTRPKIEPPTVAAPPPAAPLPTATLRTTPGGRFDDVRLPKVPLRD
jgi:putative transposase